MDGYIGLLGGLMPNVGNLRVSPFPEVVFKSLRQSHLAPHISMVSTHLDSYDTHISRHHTHYYMRCIHRWITTQITTP